LSFSTNPAYNSPALGISNIDGAPAPPVFNDSPLSSANIPTTNRDQFDKKPAKRAFSYQPV